jgi:hypothetical protein
VQFDEPIDLPGGRKLVTLEDAGNYITKLPEAEYSAPEWQNAMEALMLVATRGGPAMLARIGVIRAMHRNEKRVFNTDRKETLGKAEAETGPVVRSPSGGLFVCPHCALG